MLRRFRTDLLILMLLFLLPLILFWPQTIGGQTLIPTENLYQYEPYASYRPVVGAPEVPQNHLVSDLVLQNYQWKSFIRSSIDQREVPLWNPHQFGGIPFLAAGQQSAFYPLSVLYYVLPLPAAYGWFTVLNLWLAGVFMFALLRGLGVDRIGGVVAGIVYQLCGFFIASAVFPMILGGVVWLPLILLMVEWIIRRQPIMGHQSSVPWVVIGAGAVACNIFAGHAEITIYTLLIAGYYSALRLLWELWRGDRDARIMAVKSATWLLVMVALGVTLSGIQLIPLYEFVNTNWRAERDSLETVLSYAHPFRDLVQYLMPNFYGSPAHHQVFDLFNMEQTSITANAFGDAITNTEWGIKNYVEGALYLGILPLALATFAVVDSWRSRRTNADQPPYRVIFALLVLVSFTFMFGLPSYAVVYYTVPGINQLNTAFRWVYGVTVGIAVLAGFGAHLLTQSNTTNQQITRWFARLMAGAGVLILAGLLVSRILYTQIEPLVQRVFEGMALAQNAFPDTATFYSYEFANAAVFGLVTLLSSGVFWLALRKRAIGKIPLWQAATVVLIAADLMIASWGFNPASDPALLDFTPPGIEWLLEQQAENEPFRYTVINDPTRHADLLKANSTMQYGLDDIRGYDSIIGRQTVDYMRTVGPQNQLDHNRIAPLYLADLDAIDWQRLDWLNVRYIVTMADTILPETLTVSQSDPRRFPGRLSLAYEDPDGVLKIWRNNRAYDRASLIYTPEEDTPTFDSEILYGQQAFVGQDSGREKFIDVRLNTDHNEWLIYSETYAEGWRAFIRPRGGEESTEQEITVERILDNFIGIPLENVAAEFDDVRDDLPAAQQEALTNGDYTVRLVYSPTSFQVGMFSSVVSAALLMFMIGVWLWRWFVVPDDSDSTVSRVARNSLAPIVLNLFNRGIDFAFAFVMLRILGPEDAGIYYYAIVVFVWFDIFTNFGLDVFLIREAARQRERAGFVFANTSILRLVLMLACVPLLLGFLLVRQSAIEPELNPEALLAIGLLYIGLAPGSISKGLTSLFYAFEKAEIPAAVTTITTVNKTVFGLTALLLGYGIVGLAGVSIFTNLITLGILAWLGRGLFTGVKPDGEAHVIKPALIRGMVRESWPLMLNHFLATIFFQIDIVILEAAKGAAIVGKYSVAYRWLLSLNIIPAFFTQALLPVMSRQANEDRAALRRTYSLGVKLLALLAVPLAVMFTFMAEGLTLLLGGSEFVPEGAVALQIMIWSIPIGWINSLTQYALIAVDLQRRITTAFTIAVTFNIATNILLIPQFGYQAAAITTIFSEIVLLIPFGLMLQKELGGLMWVDMLWRPIAAGAALAATLLILWPIMPVFALVVGGGVYGVVIMLLHPFNAAEQALLQPLMPGPAKRLLGLN